MITREIGYSGLFVNAIGLGCMGLSEFYGPATDTAEATALLQGAIEDGVNHFDTAELYGMGANEKLLGAAFEGRRNKVIIATKFGPVRDLETGAFLGVDGSEANMRRAVEASLTNLKTDYIDLYYLHRMDQNLPIEETVASMAKLVTEGKVRAIGLSEASAETLRRGNAIHPIQALQSEYSIFSRDIEGVDGVEGSMTAAQDIGASLVAYSPLGRGMLTGRYTAENKPGETDFRAFAQPRFAEGAYEANLALVEEVKAVADATQVAASQIALAWVLSRGDHVISIPGTTKRANLQSNLAAADIQLSPESISRLDKLADAVQGLRYPAQQMSNINT
jgi:aryl-alcohol dehydrogenase-like predicted oxidoreductase